MWISESLQARDLAVNHWHFQPNILTIKSILDMSLGNKNKEESVNHLSEETKS